MSELITSEELRKWAIRPDLVQPSDVRRLVDAVDRLQGRLSTLVDVLVEVHDGSVSLINDGCEICTAVVRAREALGR